MDGGIGQNDSTILNVMQSVGLVLFFQPTTALPWPSHYATIRNSKMLWHYILIPVLYWYFLLMGQRELYILVLLKMTVSLPLLPDSKNRVSPISQHFTHASSSPFMCVILWYRKMGDRMTAQTNSLYFLLILVLVICTSKKR